MSGGKIPGRGNPAGSVRVRVMPGQARGVRIVASAGGGAVRRAADQADLLLVRRVREGKPGLGGQGGRARAQETVIAVPDFRHLRASNVHPAGKAPRGVETGSGIRGASRVPGWT